VQAAARRRLELKELPAGWAAQAGRQAQLCSVVPWLLCTATRLCPAMTARTSGAALRCLVVGIIAIVAGLAEPGQAQMQKQNTTWIYPTLGCRANRAGESCYPFCTMPLNAPCEKQAVCAPAYVKTPFGKTIQWVMAASNPTPPDNVYIIRTGGMPADSGKSCCGFSPVLGEDIWTVQSPMKDATLNPYGVLAPEVINWPPMKLSDVANEFRTASVKGAVVSVNLAPEKLNITNVKFSWNVTRQEASTFAVTPLYNISFDARYGYSILDGAKRLYNNSACTKNVFFRICSNPFFTAQPTDSTVPLMGSPNPLGLVRSSGVPNSACGLSVHTPCIRSPGYSESAAGSAVLQVFDVGMFDSSGANHGVRVGQQITLELTLTTLDEGGKVAMSTVDDPGLPIGAELTEERVCGQYKICRTFIWTPRKGQEDKVHDAHVVGRSFTTLGAKLNPCDELYTKETVFRVMVLKPLSTWLAPLNNVGQLTGDLAAWPGNAAVGTEFNVTLQCESNYQPRIDMDGGAARFSLLSTQDTGDGKRVSTYSFGYTPVRGDEGSTKTWQFHCGDDQDVAERLIRTVVVKTKLCTYTVDTGETLSTMTRRYQLSTNWLNVWNANPMLITDPDLDLMAGAQLRIGPVYSVKPGDTLDTIAGKCHCNPYLNKCRQGHIS